LPEIAIPPLIKTAPENKLEESVSLEKSPVDP
jgi:hypothetical protein